MRTLANLGLAFSWEAFKQWYLQRSHEVADNAVKTSVDGLEYVSAISKVDDTGDSALYTDSIEGENGMAIVGGISRNIICLQAY